MRYGMLVTWLSVCFVSANLFALERVDIDGLSKEEIARLQIQAEQMKNKPAVSVEKTREYVELGEMIGKAVAGTAKEMNIAVNEFAQTPVGKTVFFMVAYKIFGNELMHFFVGGCMLLVGLPSWWYLFRRLCLIKEITYAEGWWIFRAKKIVYYPSDHTTGDLDGMRAWMFAFLFIIIAISQITMWTGGS